MSSAITTYAGRYFPQDFPQDERKENKQVQTPQRRPTARTIEIKHRERKDTRD